MHIHIHMQAALLRVGIRPISVPVLRFRISEGLTQAES